MPRGAPRPVEGKCNAKLQVWDDHGHNEATILCQLEPLHEGDHQESWVSSGSGRVTVTWEREDRQIAIDALQQEIENAVASAHPSMLVDFDYIEEQNLAVTKLYCHERAVFFRLDCLVDVWVSIGSTGPGETLPKDRAVAKLIEGLNAP